MLKVLCTCPLEESFTKFRIYKKEYIEISTAEISEYTVGSILMYSKYTTYTSNYIQ
jgi:hypothetical protein